MADNIHIDKDKLYKICDRKTEKGLSRACDYLVTYVKKSFPPGGSGRVYIRGGKVHHASAPGEIPAVDTGHLRRHIYYKIDKEKGVMVGKVGTNVKYGRDLEFGGPKVKERPYLRPALAKNKAEIYKQFIEGAKNA